MGITQVESGYFSHVQETIAREFEMIGITFISMNLNQIPVDPFIGGRGGIKTVADIEFTCDEHQLPYIRPFINSCIKRRSQMRVFPDVYCSNEVRSIDYDSNYKDVTYIECKMRLCLGGSMDSFVKKFREATENLRFAVESKKFDEEVEEVLADDEYNS